jgi:ribosomal protein S18 acetylase RimI-like enzyme
VEQTLLRHMIELLLNSPQLDRIESQLLLHPSGTHSAFFIASGFEIYRRLFMVQPLFGRSGASPHIAPLIILPAHLQLRPWNDNDLTPAARLICASYGQHPDSLINEQYRTVSGSMRFLNNIVRYSGCGAFTPSASYVIVDRSRRELAAMILGSRVSPQSGHITQICVHPNYRRMGLGRKLLSLASHAFAREGAQEISLTVTESNSAAVELYRSEGYTTPHFFDAAVWQRPARA